MPQTTQRRTPQYLQSWGWIRECRSAAMLQSSENLDARERSPQCSPRAMSQICEISAHETYALRHMEAIPAAAGPKVVFRQGTARSLNSMPSLRPLKLHNILLPSKLMSCDNNDTAITRRAVSRLGSLQRFQLFHWHRLTGQILLGFGVAR